MSTRTSDFSFTRVEQYASRRFREAMQIYQAEFPAQSRLSITKIRQLLRSGKYQLFVASGGEQVVGFALLWVCKQPAFVHLDYIAVSQEKKGQGVGTLLYRWLLTHLTKLSPRASLLTLEVDDELVGFYQRSYTRVLQDVPYLFPGRQGPLPMNLMVYDILERTTLNGRLVQNVIRALYRGIHNRGENDSLLRSFLSLVPRSVSLA